MHAQSEETLMHRLRDWSLVFSDTLFLSIPSSVVDVVLSTTYIKICNLYSCSHLNCIE